MTRVNKYVTLIIYIFTDIFGSLRIECKQVCLATRTTT